MILLVVDMQKGLVDEDLYAFDTFTERTTQLVDAARKNNVEVIFVQHDAGPDSGMLFRKHRIQRLYGTAER